MSPNPTARPFIVGALLFLVLIGFWPSGARAPRTSLVVPAAVTRHVVIDVFADAPAPARPFRIR